MKHTKNQVLAKLPGVNFIQQRLQEDFWRHSAIFFVGSLAVGLLNYLYYPILGRLMRLTQFGEVQALFSILINLTILFTALTIVIINITANTKQNFQEANIVELEQAALLVVLLGAVPWILAASWLRGFLRMESVWPIILFYLTVIIGLLTATRQAFLQGRQDFLGTSIGQITGAVGKLLLSVGLVLAGWGVIGAVLGLILGQLLGLWYSSRRCKLRGLQFKAFRLGRPNWRRLLPDLRYGLPVLVVSLAVTLLYSSDIIAIKHYFSPLIAGQYAGIAAIGRIIFFVTGSIGAVMFSSIKLENTRQQNIKLMLHSLALMSLIGGGVLVVFAWFPSLVVSVLVGSRYLASARVLPLLATALFLIAILNLLFYYDLALRRRRVAYLAAAAVVLMSGLLVIWHGSISQIIYDILYTTIVILVVTVGLSLPRSRKLES